MFKKTAILLAILSILLGGGFWIWGERRSEIQEPIETKEEAADQVQDTNGTNHTPSEEESIEDAKGKAVYWDTEIHDEEYKLDKVNTSKWKTYVNEEFGFKIKYPGDWYVKSPAYKGSGSRHPIYGTYYVLGLNPEGFEFEGDWTLLISVNLKNIDDMLDNPKYNEIRSKEEFVANNYRFALVEFYNDVVSLYAESPYKILTLEIGSYFNEEKGRSISEKRKREIIHGMASSIVFMK